jgi:hypothetical protein
MVKRAEPADETYTVTQDWLDRATAAFEVRGRGAKVECAKKIGCSPSAITKILSGPPGQSSGLVGAISRFLDIPPPSMTVSHEIQIRLQHATAKLIERGDEAALEHALWLIERLSRDPDNKR